MTQVRSDPLAFLGDDLADLRDPRGEDVDDHVAEGGRRHHVGQIGPRKGRQITRKEADQQRDSRGNPRRKHGGYQCSGIRQRD